VLGWGVWGSGLGGRPHTPHPPNPNPQSPIPNPHQKTIKIKNIIKKIFYKKIYKIFPKITV